MIEEERDVEEQSNDVENVDFDASAFADIDEPMGKSDNETEAVDFIDEDETTEEEKSTDDESENEETDSQDDYNSAWELEPQEDEIVAEQEEEVSEQQNNSWEEIAEAAGINADDYDTFIETLRNQNKLAQKGATNENVENLKMLKSLDDEELMRRELKAQGYKEDEIEDEIDILIENGTIRSQARKVRKDLDSVIERESQRIINMDSEEAAMQAEEAEKAQEELSDYMSKTNEMFGGTINDKQKQEHVDYITNGNFFTEIGDSVENVAQAAWLWRYRKQILKAMQSSGFEKGKAKILDELVHPESKRSTRIPDPVSGEFSPSRFLDGNEM